MSRTTTTTTMMILVLILILIRTAEESVARPSEEVENDSPGLPALCPRSVLRAEGDEEGREEPFPYP